jgi:hypothetical protein
MEMCGDRGSGKQRRRQKYAEMEVEVCRDGEYKSVLLYFDDLHNTSYACTYGKRNETCPY